MDYYNVRSVCYTLEKDAYRIRTESRRSPLDALGTGPMRSEYTRVSAEGHLFEAIEHE